MTSGSSAGQSGFTYAGVLLAVLATALALGGGAHLFGNELRRDKEAELLYAGDAIRRAIEGYHAKNTGGMYPFPKQLEWLLRDPNQPGLIRHLRRIYRDPMHDPDNNDAAVSKGEWVLILDASDQIIGVHSNSMREPLRKDGFPKVYEAFRETRRYADWKFIAAGGVPAVTRNPAAQAISKNFIPTPVAPVEALTPPVPLSRGPAVAPAAPPPVAPAPAETGAAPPPPPPVAATTLRNTPAPAPAGDAPPAAAPVTAGTPPPGLVAPAPPGAPAAPPTVTPPTGTPAAGTPPAAPGQAGTPPPAAPATAQPPAPQEATPPLTSTPESFIIRAPKGF